MEERERRKAFYMRKYNFFSISDILLTLAKLK